MMIERPSPDRDRLSVMTALVFLTYGLIRIVTLPTLELETTILGLLVRLILNTRLIMLTVAALLTAAGADWLVRSHPHYEPGQSTLTHWVIPGMAALATGSILTRLPQGIALWIGLPLGALILVGVLYAEFLAVDPDDPRYGFTSVGLRSLAYLLLAGTLFTMRATDLRAVYSIPATLLAITAISWRLAMLYSRQSHTALVDALLIGLIGSQISWAAHYWPLPPIRLGLAIGLLVYIGNGLMDMLRSGQISRGLIVEFSILGVIGYGALFIFT
jgi:hypothetical protein